MKKSICSKLYVLTLMCLILVSAIFLIYISRINMVQGVNIDSNLIYYKDKQYQMIDIKDRNYTYSPISLKHATKGYILTEWGNKGIKKSYKVYEFNDGDFGSILFSPGFPGDLWFASENFSFPDETKGDKVDKVIFIDGTDNNFYFSGTKYDVNEKDFVDTIESVEDIDSFLNFVKRNSKIECSQYLLNVSKYDYLEVWIQFENRSLLKKVCRLERQNNDEYKISLVTTNQKTIPGINQGTVQ